jgi:phosphoglycolate phosphatase
LQLVIFDVDGTIVDSQQLILAAQQAAFAANSLPAPSRERSLSIVGLSLREAFTALVGPTGPVEELAEAYRQAFAQLRADPNLHEPLFPGAAELLGLCAEREDVVLGIATGKSRRGISHLLERHGWDRLFATIQTADDAPSKPDPTMIRQAIAETGMTPETTTMIGDTSFDMAMARGARVRPIGVTWGYHPVSALEEAGAAAIVDSYDALRPLLFPG